MSFAGLWSGLCGFVKLWRGRWVVGGGWVDGRWGGRVDEWEVWEVGWLGVGG